MARKKKYFILVMAFYKNKKLEKVEIGSSVRTIGSRAFYQTKKLKFIDIRSKKLKSVGKAAFIGIQKQAKIKVPRDKKAAYVKLLAKKYGCPLDESKKWCYNVVVNKNNSCNKRNETPI